MKPGDWDKTFPVNNRKNNIPVSLNTVNRIGFCEMILLLHYRQAKKNSRPLQV